MDDTIPWAGVGDGKKKEKGSWLSPSTLCSSFLTADSVASCLTISNQVFPTRMGCTPQFLKPPLYCLLVRYLVRTNASSTVMSHHAMLLQKLACLRYMHLSLDVGILRWSLYLDFSPIPKISHYVYADIPKFKIKIFYEYKTWLVPSILDEEDLICTKCSI